MTPDWAAKPATVPYAKFGDPQTLNLYAYTENGPVNNVDADGHLFGNPGLQAMLMANAEANSQEQWAAGQTQPVAQTTQTGQTAQQQGLSSKSDKAIDKAAKKYGYDASTFKDAMTQAGNKYKLDPNLLVGLGMRESSLNPSQSNGGLFQIQDPKAYGIDPKDIGIFEVQIPAAAANLSGNISHFNGNIDLGIAAWTLG
jgi:hypothetical protein